MAGKNMSEVLPISAQENENMITAALTYFDAPSINLHDPEAVRQRILDYFRMCTERRLRPSNLGMYAALGMTRQDVSNVLTGKSRTKVNPVCIDMIKKAKLVLSTYRESLAISGKLNPATAIFWSKNFDGMADVTTLEVSRADELNLQPSMTPEEISRQIELDIPIDSEAEILKP
jgi:hypothetical protein